MDPTVSILPSWNDVKKFLRGLMPSRRTVWVTIVFLLVEGATIWIMFYQPVFRSRFASGSGLQWGFAMIGLIMCPVIQYMMYLTHESKFQRISVLVMHAYAIWAAWHIVFN